MRLHPRQPPKPTVLERLREIVGPEGWVSGENATAPFLVEPRGRFHGAAALILRPGSTGEVAEIVRVCAENETGIVPQGGNTGLVGGAVPSADGSQVLMNLARMNRVREMDAENSTVTVEAGCVLAALQSAADATGCLFPLSLAAEESCQIGGNLATNAGGVHVVGYGTTRALTLGLEVVLPDGHVWNGLRSLLKDNSGYDLKHLFVGSEGTLGIITAATMRLFPRPQQIVTAMAAVSSIRTALAAMTSLQAATGNRMVACEILSARSTEFCLRHLPDNRAPFRKPYPWTLLVEFHGGVGAELRSTVGAGLANLLESTGIHDAVLAETAAQSADLWRLRKGIPEAQTREGGSIKHDISVPPQRLEEFMERATSETEAALPGVRVVAFGHLGDGNLHFNLSQPEGGDRDMFLGEWERLSRIVHDIAIEVGGSISAEHGIGLAKSGELERLYSPVEIGLMRTLKAALDPKGIMNPGKLLA